MINKINDDYEAWDELPSRFLLKIKVEIGNLEYLKIEQVSRDQNQSWLVIYNRQLWKATSDSTTQPSTKEGEFIQIDQSPRSWIDSIKRYL